jgi:nucleoside-diphosphate-sugar epimerase
MKKKVVVTGGVGFIGANLCELLHTEGYEVHAIDNLAGGLKRKLPKGVFFHNIDIRDGKKLSSLFKKLKAIDGVFHLAALPRVQFSINFPIESNDTNVSGTVTLLKVCGDFKVKKFIYSASSSAYGDQKVMPLEEGMVPAPKSPYALQKYIGEQYCKLWSEVYGLPTVCLRYFNVYGPGMDPKGAYALVIGLFLKLRMEGKPLTITGDGNQTRDFTHVRDIARANLLAMKGDVGGGEVINLGTGIKTSVNQLAEMIGGEVKYVPARLEPRDTKASNKKAQRLLGWKPSMTLREGINELKELHKLN